ncbi:MAG: LptE family protein [Verrucomicrobiota bacterium]
MRSPIHFLLVAAAVALTGCAGYHLGPVNGAVAGEKSIEVLPFNNQTLQPRLGDAVTQALRERFQVDATYHLATQGSGDIVLNGVIRNFDREGVGYLNSDSTTAQNYRVGVIVHITARDRSSGRIILEKDVKGHTLVLASGDLASGERQAMPVLAGDLAQSIAALLAEGAW